MSKFNAPLFRKLIKELKLEQKKPTKGIKFDMNRYGEEIENEEGTGSCGTACCAIRTGMVRGVFPHVTPRWEDGLLVPMLPYDVNIEFGDLGRQAFGISEIEYYRLFLSSRARQRNLPAQIGYMEDFLASKIGRA